MFTSKSLQCFHFGWVIYFFFLASKVSKRVRSSSWLRICSWNSLNATDPSIHFIRFIHRILILINFSKKKYNRSDIQWKPNASSRRHFKCILSFTSEFCPSLQMLMAFGNCTLCHVYNMNSLSFKFVVWKIEIIFFF